MSIHTFSNRTTAAIFAGVRVRSFSVEVQKVARRKLLQLHAAQSLQDLRAPPGNRLEALSGNRAGFHSLRVNAQFRIVFRFADGMASDVELIDYH